jgi:isopenicillin-N epimerase
MTTRRSFLKSIVGGAAVLSSSRAAPGEDDAYWEMVRRQFPFTEERVPLNAGNLCPSPRSVSDRVASLTHDIDRDISYTNRAKFASLLEASRAKVAEHVRADRDEIALVRNTSEANSTVITGLTLGAGDEVVLWSENHPTNNVAWSVQADKLGFDVKRVDTPPVPESPEQLASLFVEAMTERTRVVAVSHLSNYSGVLLPVDAIARVTRERGIFLLVDGAQTWGALDVDVHAMGCDAFTASAHKWLCGPKEAGVLYLRRERLDDVAPHTVAFGWSEQHARGERGARKFETLGQRDDACLASLAPAVDFHLEIGRARIRARVEELATALKEGLHQNGVSLLTPMSASLTGGVCTVAIAPERRRALVFELDKSGVAGSPAGGLRLCPHIYNTMEHVERAVRGVTALLA